MSSNLSADDVAQWLFTIGPTVIPTEHRITLQKAVIRENIDGAAFSDVLQSNEHLRTLIPGFRIPVIYKLRRYWEQEISNRNPVRVDQRVAGGHDRHDDRPNCSSRPIILEPSNEYSQPYSGHQCNGNDPLLTVELLAATVDFICETTKIDRSHTYSSLSTILPEQVWLKLISLHHVRLGEPCTYATREDDSVPMHDIRDTNSRCSSRSRPSLAPPNTTGPVSANTKNLESTNAAMAGPMHSVDTMQDSMYYFPYGDSGPVEDMHPEVHDRPYHDEHATGRRWVGEGMRNTVISDANEELDLDMAEWVGQPQGNVGGPMDCAKWIRSLPPKKVPDREKKILAAIVLRASMNFDEFTALLKEEDVVTHHIQGVVLKFLMQRRREKVLSRAAAETMEENALCKKRGEMLVC